MIFGLSLDEDFTIKVGAHTWSVSFVEMRTELSESHTWGICLADKQEILINKNASYSMRLSTFFHELIHAFEYVYEVQIPHRDVNLVGDVLAQVFIDSLEVKTKRKSK